MRYPNITQATFLRRINRFVADVSIDGSTHTVHVKNTGRCRELLVEGATVYLTRPDSTTRRTEYDLVAVEKERAESAPLLINMDSQAPNSTVAEWLPFSGLFSAVATYRREYTVGSSRFDFMIDDGGEICYAEVKGVTLEEDGVAMFPDAPTERGVKHLDELSELARQGFRTYIIFLIQMKGTRVFRPNEATHMRFADALRRAKKAGVHIVAIDSVVTPDSLTADSPVKIEL